MVKTRKDTHAVKSCNSNDLNAECGDKNTGSQSWGVASLVTGICSVVGFLAPYFSIPLAVFGIVAYSVQKKRRPCGYATAGLILSIIGLLLGVVMAVVVIVALMVSPTLFMP